MVFNVREDEKSELMVTLAALVLNDDKTDITGENLRKIVEAAGGKVEVYWYKLFAKILAGRDVDELLLNAGGGGPGTGPAAGGAGAAAGGAAAGGDAAAAEPEKEESEEEESEGDMGFSLFD